MAVRNILAAASSIDVMIYEWVWYEGQRTGTVQDINRELCLAAKRGVKVRCLLHNETKGRILGNINRKTMGHLRRAGCEVRLQPMQRALHAKVWLFDGKVALIGSHNISARSVTCNVEVGCEVSDLSEVRAVSDVFERLWNRGIGSYV